MRATFGSAGVVMVALTLALRAQPNVAGEWEITLKTQVGETTWTATFEQEGGTLSGKVDLGDREILPLKGTVEGNAIEFVFVMPDLDGDQPNNLSGTGPSGELGYREAGTMQQKVTE